MSYIFTSESVSAGHPDKVCDQISDAVLDAYLAEDPNSRVACETMIKNNMVYIAGEITSLGSPDLEPIVRKTINDIGYDTDEYGFNGVDLSDGYFSIGLDEDYVYQDSTANFEALSEIFTIDSKMPSFNLISETDYFIQIVEKY